MLKSGTGFKSTVGSVAVHQWLDLTTQPHLQGGFSLTGQPVRIHGRTFPTAVQTMSSGVTAVKLKGLCTVFEGYTGFLDSDLGKIAPGDAQRFDGIRLDSSGSQIGPVHGYDTPAGPAVRRAVGITGAAAFLFGSSVNVASPPTTGYVHGVVASPRVYCNAARLPAVDDALINSIP